MDNLVPRLQDLVGRLMGVGTETASPSAPLDPPATAADGAEVNNVHQEILWLIDEVGEPRATTLRRQWAREWWAETGACPYCGERGPYHDTNVGGGPIGEGDSPRASE